MHTNDLHSVANTAKESRREHDLMSSEVLGSIAPPKAPWRERLDHIVVTMREMSRQTDPQEMVRAYGRRMREMRPVDRLVAISRRGLESPYVKITRSSLWENEVNPWKEPGRLPIIRGGLIADLIYSEEPQIFNDLVVSPDDPGYEYLEGMRSMLAIPNYDQGQALNMVLLMRSEPDAFDPEHLPEDVWLSNLFGRATHNLVLSDQLRNALHDLEQELKVVGEIQRSLLPATLPSITNLGLAAFYRTARLAGGDAYDVFPLPDGRWGLLVSDVSGHGTPAAVLMAITHSIVHSIPRDRLKPSALFELVNKQLVDRYTGQNGAFVTAFFGIYDPLSRRLQYSNAGHPAPRVKRCWDASLQVLDSARSLPLGLFDEVTYDDAEVALVPGDQVVLFTDGIPDGARPDGAMFGTERLDDSIRRCQESADDLMQAILSDLDRFAEGTPPPDDQTLLVAKVT